jgi:tetratricopeptide (TPR) repeat protein
VAFAVYCVTAGVDWLWESTAVTALGLVCGGLAAVAGGVPRPRAPSFVARVPLIGLAALLLAVQIPVLVGAAQLDESRRSINARRVPEALTQATTAIDAQPWAASGYLQRALVLERSGALRAAAVDARRATRKEPTNWEIWLILGRIEAERGRISEALRASRRAQSLNPRSPLFRSKEP